ncbi:MAG: O-antigen ligase family protein [Candidatus Magasanikbacteria bacterium]|nr:O-antigen ligase family protein [Candidatus Magasanikbacteria bacterium]
MNTRTLRRVGEYLILASLVTPLLFLPGYFVFPYVVPKAVVFRGLIILLTAIAIAIMVAERQKPGAETGGKITPLAAAVGVFSLSLLFSAAFGVDWYRSLWDNHERMLGVFTVLHYVVFFFLARFFLRREEQWQRAFFFFIGVGIVVVAIGIMQRLQPDFLGNRGAYRVVSTLGNPIYLGGYGLFIFGISLIYFFRSRGWRRAYMAVADVFGLVGIFISGTRGTMLGLLVAILLALLAIFFNGKKYSRARVGAAVVLSLLVVSGSLALRARPSLVNSLFEGSGRTRLMAWQVGWRAWHDYPVFGWGSNNYYYAFNRYYDPAFLKFGFQETWFDNAHNVFVNTLTTQGVVGLASYLAIFVVAIVLLWRRYRRNEKFHLTALCLVALLVAHLVHNFFVFENSTSYLYFFLLLAYIDQAAGVMEPAENKRYYPVHLAVFLPALGLALAAIFVTDVNAAMANHLGFRSRVLLAQGKTLEGMLTYKKAGSWRSPHYGDIAWDFANSTLLSLPRVYSLDAGLARRLYDQAVGGMEWYIWRYPRDVRARLVYMDLLRSGGLVLFELPVKDLVSEQLRVAEQLSPSRQQIAYSRVTFLAGTGQMDEAVAETKTLIARDPFVADGYFTLGRLYQFGKQYKKILPVLDRAILAGVRFTDPEQQIFAAESYEREGRFRDALYWYDQAYRANGNDRVAYKRDELSKQTALATPTALEDFFNFAKPVSSTPEL